VGDRTMNKRNKKEYESDHRLAKVFVAIIQIVMTLIAIKYTTGALQAILVVLILKELLYYFGTNTLQYIIEVIRKHRHKVPWI
jgi:hypothetical protein